MEGSIGVDSWSEMLERKRNIYLCGKIGLIWMDAIAKHVTNALPIKVMEING